MKLSTWASYMGIHYRTAWRWFKAGKIKGAFQMPSGAIFVPEGVPEEEGKENYVIIYARISSPEDQNNLDAQVERLRQYACTKDYKIKEVVKEIGSGIDDRRMELQKILRDNKATKIIVEYQDRLARFGFYYLKTLLANQHCEIEVVNKNKEDREEFMDDLLSTLFSFRLLSWAKEKI